MAFLYTPNYAPTNTSDYLWKLKELLVGVGWTVPMSSTGSSYSGSSDLLTTAANLANANAWFRLRSPTVDGRHIEWTFQRSSHENWRVKLSTRANFTGGSPGTTQTPSATDEVLLAGTGSDASPGYAAFFGSVANDFNNTARAAYVIQDAAPYGFLAHSYKKAGGAPGAATAAITCWDPVTLPGSTGTMGDPYVWYHDYNTSVCQSATGVFSNISSGQPLANFVVYGHGNAYSSRPVLSSFFTGVIGVGTMNPGDFTSSVVKLYPNDEWTGKKWVCPVIWASRATEYFGGLKGKSTFFKWLLSSGASSQDLLSLAATGDRFVINEVSVPWDNTTPLW